MFRTMFFALTLAITTSVYAEGLVIVHPSNSASIDAGDIKRIFLGKAKNFPGGGPAIPIALKGDMASEFNKAILGKSSGQLKSYWSKLVFTGKGTPPKEVDEAEMLSLVATNPDIIGFIGKGKESAEVKVVATF